MGFFPWTPCQYDIGDPATKQGPNRSGRKIHEGLVTRLTVADGEWARRLRMEFDPGVMSFFYPDGHIPPGHIPPEPIRALPGLFLLTRFARTRRSAAPRSFRTTHIFIALRYPG
jgi:hypothetical protein